jgi:hypothetical protein
MPRRILNPAARCLALLGMTAACYHQYVATAKPDPMPAAESKMVYSYLWGLVHGKDTVAVCRRSNAIDQIEVKANFGNTMIGILTLGIVVPRRVIWHCSRPQEPSSEIGLAPPANSGR